MTSKASTTASQADRQAALDALKRGCQAWEANDAEAFVANYLDDASVVQPGIHKKGLEQIRTTMAAGFAGPLHGSRAFDHPQDVRFLTDDAAVVVISPNRPVDWRRIAPICAVERRISIPTDVRCPRPTLSQLDGTAVAGESFRL